MARSPTGGATNIAMAKLQFEVQEIVDGVAAMPVIVYDGAVGGLPAACTVVAASSLNLHGAMRALHLTNLGSGWVVSTPANGGPCTRRVGTTAQSAECHVERTGKLAFYTGYVPAVGEQVAVSYRTTGRAVGRAVNGASQQTRAARCLDRDGHESASSLLGRLPQCGEHIDTSGGDVSALWSGTYRGTSLDFATDVWPGDTLD